jgi:hypothetical protein
VSFKEMLLVSAFFLIWMTCWFGGWTAGGVFFPTLETPAAIGATTGFLGGVILASFVTGVGR